MLFGDEPERCEIESGPRLAPDMVRRIACDSSLIQVTEEYSGNPLDVGRRTRAVPPALRRTLRSRDRGCRLPGCNNHRFIDAHHIRHWADGGGTSIENLVLLCRHHTGSYTRVGSASNEPLTVISASGGLTAARSKIIRSFRPPAASKD